MSRTRLTTLLPAARRLLLLVAFNVLLTALLLEGALLVGQALHPTYVLWDESPEAFRVALLRGEESNPHFAYRWNSHGFHDDEHFTARQGDHVVALLADSFGVGVVPYERNLATVAERRLQLLLGAKVTGRVAIHNLGVTRIGMDGYAYMARTEVPRLRPAQVVLAIFVGNDIEGFIEARSAPGALRQRLSPKGWLLWRVLQRVRKLRQALAKHGKDDSSPPKEGGNPLAYLDDPSLELPFFSEEAFLTIERDKLTLLDPADLDNKDRFQRFFVALDHFRRLYGDRLLVALLPDELQVNDSLWRRLIARPGGPLSLERDLPQRLIMGWCAQQGIRALNLLPILRQAEVGGRTYHLRDTHFNTRGNRVVGEALAHELARLHTGAAR